MPDVSQLSSSPEVIVNETDFDDGFVEALIQAPAVLTRVSGEATSRIVDHEGSTWRVDCLMDLHQATVQVVVEVEKTGSTNDLESYSGV